MFTNGCILYTVKQPSLRNSLAVRWLGLGAFPAKTGVQSLVGELRSCKAQLGQKQNKAKQNLV